jgi:hypothetical protein
MAGVTLALWDEVLKVFYLPAIQEQLNQETILNKFLEKNEEDVSGKNATIECHYGRNTASMSRADDASLGDAGYQKFKTAVVPMKYHYGRVRFTGPTIAATRDERGSYARVVDTEIRGMVQDRLKEDNRMLWGAGYGVLARWEATDSATAYKLQKAYRGQTTASAGFGSTFGSKYVQENNAAVPVVLTMAAATTTFTVDTTNMNVSAFVETVATYDTITATDPGVTEAKGTFYVRPGNLGTAATNGTHRLEMMGLRGIVTNTDIDDISIHASASTVGLLPTASNDPLQGLAVGSYSWWKALVDTHASGRYAGQRPLTFELMQKMFDKVEKKAGKDYGPDMILTTHAIRREYLKLCQAERRMVNTMSLDGGFTAIDYNGVPFTVDDDAIDGEIYFLTMKDLALFRMSDYDWMSKDGAILSRVSDKDAYDAILYRYCELGCKRRNAQGVLCDISYTTD